ncbi:MAG TPA: GGDEF domain-containing protein [Bryobacteraceae bacterium]|jgi:GGDEF domain-containing protein
MSIIQKLFGRGQETESLHGEIYRLDVVEELLHDALRAYQGLIDLVVVHLPKAAREIGAEHKKRLKQIRNLLDAKPSKGVISDVRQQLDSAITSFAGDLDRQIGQQEKEAKHVMAIVAVMAESMAGREKEYNVRFRGIGKKLRVLATSNDLSEIRRKLEAEVAQLEKYVDDMARDTESAVSRVQMELRDVRKPEPAPAHTEKAPVELPPPTGLGTRQDAEQAMDSRRRHDLRFCVARFSVDNLNAIVAQFGSPAAAGLMEQVSNLIRGRFEELDVVCRWSDQDLVVVTDLALPEAAMRVGDLEPGLAGPYTSGPREVKLQLRTGVIERLRGERMQDTVQRVDTLIEPARAVPATRK